MPCDGRTTSGASRLAGTRGQRPGRPRSDALKGRLRRHWATLPARLRLIRAAILLLTAALALLLLLAGLAVSATWDTVTGRDAPRTTSAAGLDLALNDMDAQAANILLSSGGAGADRMDVPYGKAVGFYGAARRTVSRELRTLAVAAEGDARAEHTVEALTENFARYQELIGRALENDGRKGGKAAAVDDYRSATALLSAEIRPESQALIAANDDAYEAGYDAARSRLSAELITVVVLGLPLLALLVVLQWYLAWGFHRILNPGLVAATLCACIAVAGQAVAASSEHLRGARRDAFDSVVALSRARAVAYDANADESRYLLVKQERTGYEQAFLDKSQQLYGIEGASIDTYDAGLEATWSAYRTDPTDLRFTGEFRRELDNITFPVSAPQPSGPSRRTPTTSATTAPSAVWSPRARSGRPSRSASAGTRTSPTPTSAPGWTPSTRSPRSTGPTSSRPCARVGARSQGCFRRPAAP